VLALIACMGIFGVETASFAAVLAGAGADAVSAELAYRSINLCKSCFETGLYRTCGI